MKLLWPVSAAKNAPIVLIAVVSRLISVVSAGATAVRIGANAVARLPFSPFRLLFKLSRLAFTAGLLWLIASNPSFNAPRSLRNSANNPRMPKPYFRIVIRPCFSPPFEDFDALLNPSRLFAALPIALPSVLMPLLIALPAIFARFFAATSASEATFLRPVPTALSALEANSVKTVPASPAPAASPSTAPDAPVASTSISSIAADTPFIASISPWYSASRP